MRKFLFTLVFALAGLLQGHAQAQQLDTANPAFQDPVTGTYYYYDQASGYYYDPENGYFYDPQRGVFYASNGARGGVPAPPVPVNSAQVVLPTPPSSYTPGRSMFRRQSMSRFPAMYPYPMGTIEPWNVTGMARKNAGRLSRSATLSVRARVS